MGKRITTRIAMVYTAKEIANKIICMAKDDMANGGDAMTNLKLQKLLYYEQGYHLAAFGTPLFGENVEAWVYGPVVPDVYDLYKEHGSSPLPFDGPPIALSSDKEEDIFILVFDAFRDFSAIGLMNRTHSESPWLNAKPKGRGTVISLDSLRKYFETQLL